ncbi:MAG: peptidoglycan editing factor PgeF [Armatimonadota bacterium]
MPSLAFRMLLPKVPRNGTEAVPYAHKSRDLEPDNWATGESFAPHLNLLPEGEEVVLTHVRIFAMITKTNDKLTIYQFTNLADDDSIRHFVTTREGGFSASPYRSLNLGFHVGDDPADVIRNRSRLAAEMEIPLSYFTFAKQVHGNRVAVITQQMRGAGSSDYETATPDTDAMITDAEDICLMILVADCVPILFYDPVKRVVGAAHAGWKGTVQQIASKVVTAMMMTFGSKPSDILAGIGPSIGSCCYIVGEEVVTQVEQHLGKEFILHNGAGETSFDLWEANRAQLLNSGVPDANIEVARICTCCNSDKFYSYRCEGLTGRFGAGIMLRNEICASCTAIHCNWCNK